MNEDVDQAIRDLERVAMSLTEVSMRLLADAIEEGSGQRPALEKQVSQARRAVEKAIRLLGGASDESE